MVEESAATAADHRVAAKPDDRQQALDDRIREELEEV